MSEFAMEPLVRNAWYIGAWSHELDEGPIARRIMGQDLVIFRSGDGAAAALEDRCCHRGVKLSLGKAVETGIQCGYHGMVFDGSGGLRGQPGREAEPRPTVSGRMPSRSGRTSSGSGPAIRNWPMKAGSSTSLSRPDRRVQFPLRPVRHCRQLHVHDGQPDGFDPPGVRPRHDHRRQSGGARRSRNDDHADRARCPFQSRHAEFHAAAGIQESRRIQGAGRPLDGFRICRAGNRAAVGRHSRCRNRRVR